MPKAVLIFADGTGQRGGMRPDQRLTNIYKLYRAMRPGPDSVIDPREQVAFYDPGIGTMAGNDRVTATWWDRIKDLFGQVTGLGFTRNVIDCYEAILRLYEPGDRIYLFGFSRGGYTARAVANVLNLCGVPTQDGLSQPLPRAGKRLHQIAEEAVRRVYNHGAGKSRERYEEQREEIAREFRAKYHAGSQRDHGDVYPEGILVFDAVAALGFQAPIRHALEVVAVLVIALINMVIAYICSRIFGTNFIVLTIAFCAIVGLASFFLVRKQLIHYAPKAVPKPQRRHWALWSLEDYDRYLDPRTNIVRHALSIDEDRKAFERVGWGKKNCDYGNCERTGEKRLIQMWFPGNHSDIGGSYLEEESQLSDITLDWMISQLKTHDDKLKFNENLLNRFPDARGMQHSEYASWLERIPSWLSPWVAKYLKGSRQLPEFTNMHPSVLERFQAGEVMHHDRKKLYRPENLRGVKAYGEYFDR